MKAETYFPPAQAELETTQQHTLAAVGLVCLAILALYAETVVSLVSIWYRSGTYAHCFVVPVIVAWLVWRDRAALRHVEIRPVFFPIAAIVAAGSIWLAASLAGVLIASQFALLLIMELAVIAVAGLAITRRLLFPLAFAFFAVPVGAFLVPTLIDWTAHFTIGALKLSGVPVYREGNTFAIPSGRWSVIEACSGIRYLIASLMGGTLFAYLTYRSLTKRLLFVAASVVVPIIANWVRAYLIVMLGHLTNNRLAVGVDHLIYGWVLFAAIIGLLFWAGLQWAEPAPASKAATTRPLQIHPATPNSVLRIWMVAGLSIAVAALWPAFASVLKRAVFDEEPRLFAIAGQATWKPSDARLTDWELHYSGARATLEQTFEGADGAVGVIVAYYRAQKQGRELISSRNTLVAGKEQPWVQSSSGRTPLAWNGRSVQARTAQLTNGAEKLSVRYLFWVNGRTTANSYIAEFWIAYAKVRGQRDDAALVLLYTPQSDLKDRSHALLQDFAAAMSPPISQMLERARAGDK